MRFRVSRTGTAWTPWRVEQYIGRPGWCARLTSSMHVTHAAAIREAQRQAVA